MKEKIKMIGSIIILLFVMILSIILFALAAKKNERIVDNREKETINIITTTTAVPQVSSVITEVDENLTETSCNSTTTTTPTSTITTTTTEHKSNEEIANEVIEGKWGNGEERKRKLIEAGYDWQEIQNKVNELCPITITTTEKIDTLSENNLEISENNSETDIAEPTKNYTEPKENMRLLGNLKITGYVATGNPTASGVMPYVGGVAMNKSYCLPYGTQIYIEGLGYYTINDTGCKYGVVDVFCSTLSECYNLTQYTNVYVCE